MFSCADGDLGVMDSEGFELPVGNDRVQVEPLQPVLVDLDRLLCVGELIAGMWRSLRLGVGRPVEENKAD